MSGDFKITQAPRDEAWLHGAEIAVPLEITVRDGEAKIEYYPSAKPLVDEFLRLFGNIADSVFSHDAISWANEKFGEFLEEYGFELSPDSGDYYINYTLKSGKNAAVPEVRRICGGEGYTDLTDTDIDGLISEGYIIYAAVVGNDIVAVANTGEPISKDTPSEVEIGVDTAEKYRRMGYGKACVCALIRELSERGHVAVYECASGNTASIRLAESLGGTVNLRKFYIVGFRKEDMEDSYGI
ncbi:MAG: GNAT family N-acetyltransferase [Clostridia bacterium]|nr:GNAT family N-acetyltransferase [Clostridia bacterium]